jgi:hypothetical protein
MEKNSLMKLLEILVDKVLKYTYSMMKIKRNYWKMLGLPRPTTLNGERNIK